MELNPDYKPNFTEDDNAYIEKVIVAKRIKESIEENVKMKNELQALEDKAKTLEETSKGFENVQVEIENYKKEIEAKTTELTTLKETNESLIKTQKKNKVLTDYLKTSDKKLDDEFLSEQIESLDLTKEDTELLTDLSKKIETELEKAKKLLGVQTIESRVDLGGDAGAEISLELQYEQALKAHKTQEARKIRKQIEGKK